MATETQHSITDDQCQRWRHSLKLALEDPEGYKHFYRFLELHEKKHREEYCMYLDFWKECEDYKKQNAKTVSDLKKSAEVIVEKYLSSSAKNRIALDGDEEVISRLKEVLDNIEEDNEEELSVLLNIFEDAVVGMRKYIERGGCKNAYKEWTEGLKSEEKKKQKFKCRLM